MDYTLSAAAFSLCIALLFSIGSSQMQMAPRCPPYIDQNSSVNSLAIMSKSVEAFSLDLFDRTVNTAGDSLNIVLSPFSVWSTLVIVAEGSLGYTYDELARVLRLPISIKTTRTGYRQISQVMLVNTSTVELETVNALFTDINRPVERDYECLVETAYHSELNPVNFQNTRKATDDINAFVRQRTRNRVNGIVVEEDLINAQMILTNAIFFRGQWTTPFNKSNTRLEPFYDERGNVIGNVNMMFDVGYYPYIMVPNLNAHVIEIPYGKENRLSMFVLLPMKGASLREVLGKAKSMSLEDLTKLMSQAADEYSDEAVELRLPRFKMSSDLVLNVILEDMGIISMFYEEANLTKISKRNLRVSRIIHKAEIEVTEEGTVASAVTAGSIVNKIAPPSFNANRPFAYFIMEKSTKVVVFVGKFSYPPPVTF